MTIKERIQIVEEIWKYLQANYTRVQIDEILATFKLPNNGEYTWYDSKRLYVKYRLTGVPEETILEIQKDLEIPLSLQVSLKSHPKNWEGKERSVKVFISHLSSNKWIAKRLKDCLEAYNAVAFVAHEDILPTEPWANEIKNALDTMDIFISLHTSWFSNSYWCQQEVGYAFASWKKIIPIKFDENPVWFLASIQALSKGMKTGEIITQEIFDILKKDKKTSHLYDKIFPPINESHW